MTALYDWGGREYHASHPNAALPEDGVSDASIALNTLANTTLQPKGGIIQLRPNITYVIAVTRSIPRNTPISIPPGTRIQCSSGVTLTAYFIAGPWQIFDTSGGGTIKCRNEEVWLEWFGLAASATAAANGTAITKAFQAAMDIPNGGPEFRATPGVFNYDASIVRPASPVGSIALKGFGPPEIYSPGGVAGTTFQYTGTGVALRIGTDAAGNPVTAGQGFHLSDFKIKCTANARGIEITNVSGGNVSRVMIEGPGTGTSTKEGVQLYDVQSWTADEVRVFGFDIGLDLPYKCYDITVKAPLIDQCNVGVRVGNTDKCVNVRFLGGTVQRPTTWCVDILRASGLYFFGMYFESNGSGKRVFRIGNAAAVPETVGIYGGTMQGLGTPAPNTEWAIELRRVKGLTICDVQYDNYQSGLINNIATDVKHVTLINNFPAVGSAGAGTVIDSLIGVTLQVGGAGPPLAVDEVIIGNMLRYPPHSAASRPGAGTIGRTIFNTSTGKPNWDTGTGWVHADGSVA